MINAWMVRAVAILDVFLGVMVGAADIWLPVSGPSSELRVPAALCIVLGVIVFALDRYEWTRPAAVMAVMFQIAGVVAALAYISLG
ncbi:hypothetical protein Y017_01465 [Alcanivorax sp. 97CO-5]|jgi:hypothetical protein|uniref:hypothetical protein n=1 Tax=unclassified Alcanivorax TaxID=2638842 RepID=UPI0003E7ECEE|nr:MULTISPECIES: hypothetical protein [unclassified Alcanivorax]EUC71707.1 hypothetical protein Y017_01465 [Alcanivorax sp. 97CO-5]PKG02891.1 hypothetical protein Y019_01460 [Alcanivorax sp. 97CO-6]